MFINVTTKIDSCSHSIFQMLNPLQKMAVRLFKARSPFSACLSGNIHDSELQMKAVIFSVGVYKSKLIDVLYPKCFKLCTVHCHVFWGFKSSDPIPILHPDKCIHLSYL